MCMKGSYKGISKLGGYQSSYTAAKVYSEWSVFSGNSGSNRNEGLRYTVYRRSFILSFTCILYHVLQIRKDMGAISDIFLLNIRICDTEFLKQEIN